MKFLLGDDPLTPASPAPVILSNELFLSSELRLSFPFFSFLDYLMYLTEDHHVDSEYDVFVELLSKDIKSSK